jgi:ribonuclease G
VPSLEAYFIDVGTELPGFLPAKFISKKPKTGSPLVLQVVKPQTFSKGMTLSNRITIAGDMCVITSEAYKRRVSGKIKSTAERDRLSEIAGEHCPEGLGIILRTIATERSDEDIIGDIERTTDLYNKICSQSGSPGKVIYTPAGIIHEVMRTFSPSTDIAYFNDKELFDKYFMKYAVPGLPSSVKYYDKPYDLFAFFNISNKIKEAAGRRVRLKSGGTIVFDYTEAMCVIDVNTSKNTGSASFEETALETNMEAAREIAIQIRLRNIGGIIVIDFIDMNKENNEKLNQAFRKYLSGDDRKMTIGGFTSLGNYELTRLRKGVRLKEYHE